MRMRMRMRAPLPPHMDFGVWMGIRMGAPEDEGFTPPTWTGIRLLVRELAMGWILHLSDRGTTPFHWELASMPFERQA
jgi:hypothetical protein